MVFASLLPAEGGAPGSAWGTGRGVRVLERPETGVLSPPHPEGGRERTAHGCPLCVILLPGRWLDQD